MHLDISHGNVIQGEKRGSQFRALHQDDVAAVNGLYFGECGPQYPYPLSEVVAEGVKIVVECDSEIVGFARAMPYRGYGRVYEFGGLIVHKSYRECGMASHLTQARINASINEGGVLAVSEPVCNLPSCASQHNLFKHGFYPVGLEPFKYPELKPDLLGDQPESVMLVAKDLAGRSRFGFRKLYLPESWLQVLSQILPQEIWCRGWKEKLIPPMPAVLEEESHKGRIQSGARFVDVPANWSETMDHINYYLGQGYRFCGILPGFGEAINRQIFDYGRLYKPLHGSFSFDLVHVAPSVQVLKDFLQSE